MTSLPIRLSTDFMTFIPSLTFTELWVVSMEHMQRVWLAIRERLPFRTPGSVPYLGLANAPIVETKLVELAMSLLDFSPWIPLGTFTILLWAGYSPNIPLGRVQCFRKILYKAVQDQTRRLACSFPWLLGMFLPIIRHIHIQLTVLSRSIIVV